MGKILATASLCALLSLLAPVTRAQTAAVATGEISFNNSFDFKLKPSYSIKGGKKEESLELMAGKRLKGEWGKAALYSDMKGNLDGMFWMGARSEIDLIYLGSHMGIQARHFSGLNERSTSHYYLIPFVMQDVLNSLSVGICDYIKTYYSGKKGFAYLGPFVSISFGKSLNAFLLYGKDKDDELFYLKLNLDMSTK
jgi:hypothetical protein